jgi:SAM-dependent methyltransferase
MRNPSGADAVNHHAGHPGFAGATGLLAGLTMIVGRRAVARLAADLVSVSDTDRVVDVGCGPGTAVREAARRGARVTGVDPASVMLRLARTLTRDRLAVIWAYGAAENLRQPEGSATVVWPLATVHHWTHLAASPCPTPSAPSLTWRAGFEHCTVENIAAVIPAPGGPGKDEQ